MHFFCIPSFSGNITKKYKSHLTEKGTVFFIMPQKMPKTKDGTAYKDLLFDITCLNTSDSISVTATIFAAHPITDSLVTIAIPQGHMFSIPTEIIYYDLSKKGYESRVRFHLLKNDLRQLFNAKQPFLLDYGKGNVFSFTTNKWTEKKGLINSIIDLMEIRH